MYVLVRAGLYPGLSVYCLLLTAFPVLQSICSGVREILFCTSVLVEQSVCVHPLFVLHCIVLVPVLYYKSLCVCLKRLLVQSAPDDDDITVLSCSWRRLSSRTGVGVSLGLWDRERSTSRTLNWVTGMYLLRCAVHAPAVRSRAWGGALGRTGGIHASNWQSNPMDRAD